jgi:hypothetical protein
MVKLDFSETRLFKYLSPDGAKKSLSTRTIKLSKPSEFNDPFDMRLDRAFGLDHREFVETQIAGIVDFLSDQLDINSLRSSKIGDMAGKLSSSMRNASPEKKKWMRDELMATPVEEMYDFESLKNVEAMVVGKVFTHSLATERNL